MEKGEGHLKQLGWVLIVTLALFGCSAAVEETSLVDDATDRSVFDAVREKVDRLEREPKEQIGVAEEPPSVEPEEVVVAPPAERERLVERVEPVEQPRTKAWKRLSEREKRELVTETEKEWRAAFPEVYDVVREAIDERKPSFTFSLYDIHEDDVLLIVEHLIETSRYETYIDSWETWLDDDEGEVRLTYELDREEIERQEAFVKEEVERIVHEVIEPNDSEYERVKKLHDYIVRHTAYDEEAANRCTDYECYGYDPANTAYGLLVNRQAVCEGYARLLTALLDRVGVRNYYVVGDGGGEAHAWNLVQVDGAYYYVDATWNDPVPDEPGVVLYDYFLVPTHELYDHAWVQTDYPPTASERYEP